MGWLGINQSKNASSSASTDSHEDNSSASHNTDNSVGAGSSGNVSTSAQAYGATIDSAGGAVNVTDAGAVDRALSFASDALTKALGAGRSSQSGVAAAQAYGSGGDSSAVKSAFGSVPVWAWAVGGGVLVIGVAFMLRRRRK